ANFGVRSLSTFDPDLKRPYQNMYNVGVTREVTRGTSLSVEWFHGDFKNLIARNNMARSASDYTKVTVYSPIDGTALDYYNVSAAKLQAVQNVDSNDPNLKRTYNGIEVNVNARLPRGVRIFGGTPNERIIANPCSAAAH